MPGPDAGARAAPRPAAPQLVRFQDVLDLASAYLTERDLASIRRAYVFCAKAHEGQSRLSGEPYLVHPLAVAAILAERRMDPVTVVAGLLHDVLEDTLVSPEEIRRLFGAETLHVVDGVTKLSKLAFSTREEAQAESFRKLILAMADDLRVMLVKLADRLHNMRTLGYLPREKQVAVARETLEIYAPIAHRLGMGRLKSELEDLAFRHVDPERHAALVEDLEQRRSVEDGFIADVERRLKAAMEAAGLEARVRGRRKSIFSIHKKLQQRGIGIEEVHDHVAFRITTRTVADCYTALGVIHAAWTPIQSRFKDLIAMPKPNGYRSLHTTVAASSGQSFEVQIRTEEMHLVAEEGIAAHWGYKEGSVPSASEAQRFAWLRNLLDAQREHADPGEFLQAVKMDLYGDEVYCFTPKGELKVLPSESTPLDFAYAIHTEVGHHCVGARIDGALVPLRTKLAHGNRVEILTSTNQRPRRDWIAMVVTARARSKIRQWLNAHEREEALDAGRLVFEREARRRGTSSRQVLRQDVAKAALESLGFKTVDDYLVAIARDRVSAAALLTRALGDQARKVAGGAETRTERRPTGGRTKPRRSGKGADVSPVTAGEPGLLIVLARCCHPIRGEDILGFVTRGRGVSVHLRACRNVRNLERDAGRLLVVTWDPASRATFDVRLRVSVHDRAGILGEVTNAVSLLETNIRSASAKSLPSRRGTIDLTVELTDVDHLARLRNALERIDGVVGVER